MKNIYLIPMEKLLEEVVSKIYPINNTGSMFMANREEVNNSYRQEGFIEGVNYAEKSLYNEEDVKRICKSLMILANDSNNIGRLDKFIDKQFDNFKKK